MAGREWPRTAESTKCSGQPSGGREAKPGRRAGGRRPRITMISRLAVRSPDLVSVPWRPLKGGRRQLRTLRYHCCRASLPIRLPLRLAVRVRRERSIPDFTATKGVAERVGHRFNQTPIGACKDGRAKRCTDGRSISGVPHVVPVVIWVGCRKCMSFPELLPLIMKDVPTTVLRADEPTDELTSCMRRLAWVRQGSGPRCAASH